MPLSAAQLARRAWPRASGMAAEGSVWPLAGLAALLLAATLAWCLWHGLALAAAASAACLGALVGLAAGHATAVQAACSGPGADAMHNRLQREQALFDMQAEQLEDLRRQAHTDPLTGLANRRHFVQALDAVLADERLPAGASLLLLRLHDLQGMNRRVGRSAGDRALLAVAEAVQAYPVRHARCLAGRLNGTDFALLLPVAGMGQETASALTQALRLPLAAIDARARVFAGAVDLTRPLDATRALALADAALAWAETAQPAVAAPGVDTGHGAGQGLPPADPALAQGQQAWQRQISLALAQGRAALAAYPVQAADGRQLHLDCPLRVQLQPGGPMEPASRWLSLAIRSRLCAAVDEHALDLALAAIDADGQGRCVNMAAQSLLSVDFVAAVSRRLEDAPGPAARLWIDLPEALALERPHLVRDVARRWRVLGVRLGLEHAGDGLARITQLADLGLDCVRIDSRFVNGISGGGAADARRHLQGLVRLVQAVGLQVTAEGVRSADDLALLWQLGFDAATGPVLALPPGGAGVAG